MIEMSDGDLLNSEAGAIVNAVNCVSVMARGLALQFRSAFPENYKAYKKACRRGEVQIGKMFIYPLGELSSPQYIINFPTKDHWRDPSKVEYIQSGLSALIADVQRLKLTSIAIPALGCGLGGLEWSEVRPLIEEAFEALPDMQVTLFPPRRE